MNVLDAFELIDPDNVQDGMYAEACQQLRNRHIDWEKDRFTALLATVDYVPDLIEDRYLSDISMFEVNYISPVARYKRIELKGPRYTRVEGNHIMGYDGGGPYIWPPMIFTARNLQHIIIFRDTGKPKTSELFMINSVRTPMPYANSVSLSNPLFDIMVKFHEHSR